MWINSWPARSAPLIACDLDIRDDAIFFGWLDTNMRQCWTKIWSACSMPNANVLELEKIRTERARQKLLEQELERRERELIDADAVDRYMAEVERKLRARWVTWPARMAPKLAARFGCDETKAFEVLDRLVREQIDQLPRWRGCVVEIGPRRGLRSADRRRLRGRRQARSGWRKEAACRSAFSKNLIRAPTGHPRLCCGRTESGSLRSANKAARSKSLLRNRNAPGGHLQ